MEPLAGVVPMMDFSFLSKANSILRESTWEAINQALAQYALDQRKITSEKLRLDTTVYETLIHYPTDSSLLWDCFRVLARLLRSIQKQLPQLALKHRFHDKKVKKLAYFITRNGASAKKSTQRKVKSTYRDLIERVAWIVGVAHQTLRTLDRANYEAKRVSHYLPLVEHKPGSLDHALPLEELRLPECFSALRRRLESEREDGSREYVRVLRLWGRHSLQALTAAVQKGLRTRAHSRDAIAQFLLPQEPWEQTTFRLDGREHLRQVKVAVADIQAYAELLESSQPLLAHGGGQA